MKPPHAATTAALRRTEDKNCAGMCREQLEGYEKASDENGWMTPERRAAIAVRRAELQRGRR